MLSKQSWIGKGHEVPNVSKRSHNMTDEVQNPWETKLEFRYSRVSENTSKPNDEGLDMVTWAFQPQTSVPKFLTGRIHSQSTLRRQTSVNNVVWDKTVPVPDNTSATSQDPINRLADVLVSPQTKPQCQLLTVRPVKKLPPFDGRSEKCELLEDLFHKMTEQITFIHHTEKLHFKHAETPILQ